MEKKSVLSVLVATKLETLLRLKFALAIQYSIAHVHHDP